MFKNKFATGELFQLVFEKNWILVIFGSFTTEKFNRKKARTDEV